MLPRHPIRVLIVEDEEGIRNILAELLAEEGYAAQAVSNGQNGLEAVKRESFDVVLVDLSMKGMGGREFIEELRQRAIATPVVIMSASQKGIVVAEEVGAAAYLRKPFDIDAVLDVVERAARATWPS